MREILFRGKSNYEETENEWVYGGLLPESENTFPIIVRDYDNDDDWIGINGWSTVEPETVGQYTGLTDKNGTKIFEGDIVIVNMVHIPKQTGIVEYHKDFFGVKFEGITPTQHCVDYTMRNGEVEVIGNIHDNPELLESEVQGE